MTRIFRIAKTINWQLGYSENIVRGCEQNTGYQPMLHYAVASSVRVHGESFRDVSERSLDSPETNVA
jgi:hypothetical protein